MSEDLLHFVWKHNQSLLQEIELPNQGKVEIISTGEHNHDSGPDFFNAKIRIGETVWAGNVEIHINASDWNKHGHNTNPAYDAVILHVVARNDMVVYNSRGDIVPTIEVQYPNDLEWDLQRLVANESWIPCANHLKAFGQFNMRMWLASLSVERLEQKTIQVNDLVLLHNGSWEEAFYVSVARSFGLKINALPFEMLAKATPLKCLAKAKDNLISIEAILFGQAGMLDDLKNADPYFLSLKKEYHYQQKKFNLSPIPNHLWKFMRLRPVSFPTIRIAQFAQLIHNSSNLFSKCIESKSLADLMAHFNVSCSPFWENHYTFDKESKPKRKMLGDDMIGVIVLNSVIPFMFAYGSSRQIQNLRDKAINLLERMKSEKNRVVKGFAQFGVDADSAFFSQAMVQLKGQYCDKRKCLYCKVGANVLLKRLL